MSEETKEVENKKYRVFKLTSKNSDEYYIDYVNGNGYMCMQLHNLITRYKKNGNIPEKYKDFFYIISKSDLMIITLESFESYEEARDYIITYKINNKGFVNGVDKTDYVYCEDVRCAKEKEKVDSKKYLKDYYEKNIDKYKQRYLTQREEILKSRKEKYVKKKKNIG